jgi:predicted DNA-binding protein
MIIEQAFEIIEDFFVANQVTDPLRGMEIMVANYKQLNKQEQEALGVFMAASREKTI